jgi:protein-S-isoprenylcysteine O-methyltransferase Ste14
MGLSGLLGLIYLVSEILLSATRRGRSATGEKQDRSTLRVIWIVILASVAAGIFAARKWQGGALSHGREFAIAGVVLFAGELILRWWAIITLGRFFTVDATIEKDHEVVGARAIPARSPSVVHRRAPGVRRVRADLCPKNVERGACRLRS